MLQHRYFIALLALAGIAVPGFSAPIENATIRRIVDGNEVYIDQRQASVDQSANKGQNLSTGRSRAELLFDSKALGFLGSNSLIKLGEECFRLNQGRVLINGPQNSCLGSKVLGIRGTTYVLNTLDNGDYSLAVLSGTATVTDEDNSEVAPFTETNQDNILSLYPSLCLCLCLYPLKLYSGQPDRTA